MNIGERLAREHSKAVTTAIVNYIGSDKKKFAELTAVFFGNDPRLTQRAAWALSTVAGKHPQLVTKYLGKLTVLLSTPGTHPAIPRNILRLMQEIEVPEKYSAVVYDQCLKFITDPTAAIACKAFGITLASRIANRYPELKNELLPVLMELSQHPNTPAVRQRIKLALKQLQAGYSKI